LKSVTICDTRIFNNPEHTLSQNTLSKLAMSCTKLQHLEIGLTFSNMDDIVPQLAKFSSLKSLHLNPCTLVTNVHYHLLSQLTTLTSLGLKIECINHEGLDQLVALQNLKELSLSFDAFSSSDFRPPSDELITLLKSLKNLEKLYLEGVDF